MTEVFAEVSWDGQSFVGRVSGLDAPIVSPTVPVLRMRLERMFPGDDVEILMHLDASAREERDRRRKMSSAARVDWLKPGHRRG